MASFDVDVYRSRIKLLPDESLDTLLAQIGRNGETNWSVVCREEIEREKTERRQCGVIIYKDGMHHSV